MPLTRYQIRNEYSLADPELYRAADKDDPEAVLEGVAMAGLVGVLRQLGDLAEFAAQIFHDLHEEVMATAARGHGLMLRVQQLEAEVPSIEKAFLTQTSHSLFLLNAGVDWHANLSMDENLITRGDLPRCVMDSYEECRGPPRLFLLDKFDVSGAGTCLKRYSDPSFFRAKFTFSETMGADIQREKKARKVKKKGSRWRNGENPEFYPTSHAKLHQLLSEERNWDNNVLVHHMKLKKRQLNGFSSESTTGKSYMERFVETDSPERYCENSLVLPKLNMESSNTCEQGLEIREISTASPASKLMEREIGLISSAEIQETALEQSMYDLHEDVIKEGILEKLHEPMCDIEVEKLPSSLYKLEDQKKLVVNVESQKEVDGYQSDDITSEVDNYMDALATMESEMEIDTDSRPNNDRGFINIKRLGMDPDTKELQKHQDGFSDSHSAGNSSESVEYNLFEKGRYSPSNMDTLSNLTVKGPPGRDAAAEVATSVRTCPPEIVDVSSEKPSANDYNLESLESVVPGGSCIEVSEIPSSGSELVEASPDSCVTDSISTTSHHLSSGANLNEFQLQGPDFVGYRGPSSNTEENLVADVPRTINLSDSNSKMKDDILSEESRKSQQVEVMDGLSREVSSDALLHRSDISGLVVARKYDGSTFDTVFPAKCAEDAPTDNINRNSDSPHSITLATKEQLSCLEGQDIKVCLSTKQSECLRATTDTNDLDDLKSDRIVETDTGIPTTSENPEYVPSALDIQKTRNFAKQDLSEMKEEVPPQVDLEVGIGNSGVETLYNDLEVSSNTPDGGVGDEPALEVGQSNPCGSVGKDASSPEFPSLYLTPDSAKTAPVTDYSLQMGSLRDTTVNAEADTDSVMYRKLIGSWNCIKQQEECPLGSRDLSGLVSEAYPQLDNMESLRVHVEAGGEDNADCGCLNGSPSRNFLKLEDTCHANNGNVRDTENEVHSKLDNLTTGADHTEADVADIADFPNRIGSSSKIQMKLHEECLSNAGSEQFKLETTETRNPEFIIGEDSQKEIIQLAAASTNLDVQVNNSESRGLSSSEFPYDVHISLPVQHPQSHLHLMNITEVPKSSVEMDKELQFAQQIQPSGSAEDPICTSLSNRELRIPSEQAQVLEASQLIVESLDGERESPLLSNLLDEQTDSLEGRDHNCCPSFPSKISWFEKTEPVKDRGPDGSSDGASEFSCGDPLKRPLDFSLVPTSQNMLLTHEPTIEPLASSLPSFGMLSGTAHEQSSKPQPSEGPNASQANLEEPPLPPLPPLQWRVGKFQHSSLTAEGEMVQPSLNPFLPLGFTPLGGEIVQPPNPFLPLNSREGKHQHGSKVSEEDIVHPDMNPFSSQLPAVVGDTNNNEGSQTSEVVEEIQLPNLLLSLPATEDEKLECDLLPLGEEKAQPSLNSFAPSPATEADRPSSDTLQGESCDVQNLLEPELNMNDGAIKDEVPLNSFTPSIIKEEESLNSFAPSPATEEDRPPSDTLLGESCDVHNLSEPEPNMNDGTIKDEGPLNSFTPPIRKEVECLNSFAPSPATEEDRPASNTLPGESCDLQNLSDPEPNMNDGTIKDEPLNSYVPLIIKESSSLNSFAPPTIKEEPLNSFAPPNIKHVEPADGSLMLEGEMPSNASTSFTNGEAGVPNGKPPKKQPRPRDPLIEAVASHDRSMLRKATERAHPKIEHKMDSMLEQIRTKSFNLRPAVRPMLTTRPSIQGPRTNLNVAAILEKANAIRQATAGSDEDDNDSWSDS